MNKNVILGLIIALGLFGLGAFVVMGKKPTRTVVARVATSTQPDKTPVALPQPPTSSTTIAALIPVIPQTVLPTKDWRTCRNKKYGYEFKYPQEWIIRGTNPDTSSPEAWSEFSDCEGLGAPYVGAKNSYEIKDPYPLGVNSPATQKCLRGFRVGYNPMTNIQQISKNTSNVDLSRILRTDFAIKLYVIDGERAVMESVSDDVVCKNWYPAKLLRNSVLYYFDGTAISQELYETILSTFRFLK